MNETLRILEIVGTPVDIRVRFSNRARRLQIHMTPAGPEVVVPRGYGTVEIDAFIEKNGIDAPPAVPDPADVPNPDLLAAPVRESGACLPICICVAAYAHGKKVYLYSIRTNQRKYQLGNTNWGGPAAKGK